MCQTCWQVGGAESVIRASSWGWKGHRIGTSNRQTLQARSSSLHSAINIWPKGREHREVINMKMVQWTNAETKQSAQKVKRIIITNCCYYLNYGCKLVTFANSPWNSLPLNTQMIRNACRSYWNFEPERFVCCQHRPSISETARDLTGSSHSWNGIGIP